MNFDRYTIIIVLFLLCSISCKKDFLDVPDRLSLVRQVYVKDLKTLEAFLKGNYLTLASDCYQGLFIIYGDLAADEVKPTTGSPFMSAHYTWKQQAKTSLSTLTSSTPNLNIVWYYGYKIIRDCSFVLENVGKYEAENPSKADLLRGQAYALRAFVHFILVNAFAQPYSLTGDGSHMGIPYVTSSDWSTPVSRQSTNEVYNGITGDLEKAITLLPAGAISDARYFNHHAAKALLARVYHYKGEHLLAKNLARSVLTAVPFMTNTPSIKMYPDSLFRKGDGEALFQMYPETTYASALFPGVFFRLSFMAATNDIASVLTERAGDLRNSWITNDAGVWKVNKFPEGLVPGISLPSGAYYHTILRSSEMYLIAAESYARLAQEDSARFYLDQIRQRADITAPVSTASGPALLDSICKERRKEFAFEGLRLYELQRLKKDVNRLDASSPAAVTLPFGSNNAVAPIPLEDVNTAGLQQNTGY